MPGTKREKKFILVLDYIENRWDLWSGHQTDWVEVDELITRYIKFYAKVLRFIDDRDHEQIAA